MPQLFSWRWRGVRFCLTYLLALVVAPLPDNLAAQTLHGVSEFCESCGGLTGDWGGHRQSLLNDGVEINLINIADVLFLRQGDNDETAFVNHFDAGFMFDMEALANIEGGSAYLWGVATHGDDPARIIGSVHAPSNIAAADAFRLLEAWYEQAAYDDRLGVLVGLYAVDNEFDSKQTLNVFAGGGHGTGLDLSETGLNGPSIFPVTSFGTRIRWGVTDTVTARLAIVDGVPGDPNDPTVTARLDFSSDQGVFAIGELDYDFRSDDKFRRLVLGAWHYTTKFDDLLDTQPDGSPVIRHGSGGFYGFAEWLAFTEPGSADQGLAIAVRLGVADQDVNQIAGYYGVGVVYQGLFPGREDDALGFGFSTAVNGDKFRQAAAQAGSPVTKRETEWTLVYSAQINRWLRLQPIFQYYSDPGMDPTAYAARVGGIRIEIRM